MSKSETLRPVTVFLTKDQYAYLYRRSKELKLYHEFYFPVPMMVQRIVAEAIKTAKEAQK